VKRKPASIGEAASLNPARRRDDLNRGDGHRRDRARELSSGRSNCVHLRTTADSEGRARTEVKRRRGPTFPRVVPCAAVHGRIPGTMDGVDPA
jgi:hypothetical protein